MNNTLLTRDTKGKCRIIRASLIENEDGTYTIKRSSGLFTGKQIEQPEITIAKGKVKRSVYEQSLLEYNAIIKKLKDKGYKDINDLGIVNLTEAEIEEKLPSTVTDQNNNIKPMLCKVIDDAHPEKYKKEWYGSYKLDGVRTTLYYRDGEIHSSSRGGGNYDVPLAYVRQDPYLISLFKANPDLILDGEAYKFGWPLNVISGLMRRDDLTENHKELKFYCYDIVDTKKSFRERLDFLIQFRNNCLLDSRAVFVEHTKLNNYDEIVAYHDKAVSEGYEGAVIRDPSAVYKCGARGDIMQKIKRFKDDTFKVVGIQQGLRHIDDMVFILETKDGKQFNAKPIGDRKQKEEYTNNFETKYKNHIGELKYFYYSPDGIPLLPVFRSFRFDLE